MQSRFPSLFALAAIAAFAAPLAAQTSCPMQTTKHVPDSITYGPSQACSGVRYTLPDVQIGIEGSTCPTFVIYVPPHDVAVPSTTQTYVEVAGQLPITMVTFSCQTRWLLILPIGSDCTATRDLVVGSVQSLLARPCPSQG